MQENARKLTFGAMMIAIFIVLCMVSVYVPLIGSVTMLFTPLPIMLYRLKYDRKASLFVTAAAMILALIGGLLLLPAAFTFGVLGLAVGEAIVQNRTKLYVFMAAGTSFSITMVIVYVVTVWVTGINYVEEFSTILMDTQRKILSALETLGNMPKGFETLFADMSHIMYMTLPSVFIMSMFILGYLIVLVNLPVVKRLGHDVPSFPPFRQMKLPVLIVWVYLIIILLPFFGEISSGSMTELIYLNGTFILRFLFLLQGIAFIQYMIYEMKAQKWLSLVLIILALLMTPLTIIIGILDTGVNLRAWVRNDKQK